MKIPPWTIIPLFLVLFSGAASAVELGDRIRINQYCETVADFEAHRLNGYPNPIPDDTECYNTQHIIFQGTAIKIIYSFVENNTVFHIFEVSDLEVTYQTGEGYFISQPLTGSVFLPGIAEEEDA